MVKVYWLIGNLIGCSGPWYNQTDLLEFKLNRFNRIQRLYDNVWLWKDINIGPHGHFIFTLPVPERPALWMVSSIGVSPSSGFGLLKSPIRVRNPSHLFYLSQRPTFCIQLLMSHFRA